MYALRDVTGTVACIPLIASSIMSKKIAAGCDALLLDVKYGNGAFMKTKEEAKKLAQMMIQIGKSLGKDTKATLSNMTQPLGYAIGNSLEVKEAIETLLGNGPDDLLQLCLQSGAQMLIQAKKAKSIKEATQMLKNVIDNHKAFDVLCQMVEAQGGNVEYICHPELFKKAKEIIPIHSLEKGYVKDLKAKPLGLVSMKLGGGRASIEDTIDYSVGLVLNKKIGDYVEKDEILLYVHTNNGLSEELRAEILNAYIIQDEYIEKPILIDEVL